MDIRFKDGDFVLNGNNAYIIEDSVIQELTFRLETYKGSHWYYPNYGVKLEDAIGTQNGKSTFYFILGEIDDALNQDDRIPDNSSIASIRQSNETFYVDLDVAGKKLNTSIRI